MSEIISDKCIVKGCPNRRDQGRFVGDLCVPCHDMLTTGRVGPGQTFIHTRENVIRKAETLTFIMSKDSHLRFVEWVSRVWEARQNLYKALQDLK